jgi:MFS family permease
MARAGKRAHYQLTFAVLAMGVGAFALLQSLVIPVLTTVQHQLHTTQSTVTWVLTAYLLSASVMTPILGRVGDMFGKERVFVATLTALAVGSLLAAVAPSIGAGSMVMLAFAHHQQWEIYVSNALMGIGFGLAFSAMSALIVMAVPASQTGVASGMNANIRTIGGSIGAAAMASIVTARLAPTGLPLESGYTTGFAAMTGALVLAAGAGLLIPAVRRMRQQVATAPEQTRQAQTGQAELSLAGDGE